jgi:hypothetical protein
VAGFLRLDTLLAKSARSGRTEDENYVFLEEILKTIDENPATITGSTLVSIDALTAAGIFIHFPPGELELEERPPIVEA